MSSRLTLTLLLAVGFVTACAHDTVRDCQTVDWYALGHRDGWIGTPVSVFENYRTACREAGIAPDRTAYEKGRQEGLQAYCTDLNGFKVGRGNDVYHYVCPPDLEKTFLSGRARGKRLKGCPAQIYVFDEHLQSLERAMKQREQRLATPAVSAEDRARLMQEIDTLKPNYQQAAGELDAVERRCMLDEQE